MNEMVFFEIWAVVLKAWLPPIKSVTAALLQANLDVVKALSLASGVIYVSHICVLVHYESAVWVIVIIESIIIHIKCERKSGLISFREGFCRLRVLEPPNDRSC